MKRVLLFVVSLVLAVSLSISCVIASSAQLADSNSEYVEEISESKNEQEPSSNIFQPFIDFLKSVFCSKIIFDTDGGSEIEEYYLLKFKRISPPSDPAKEGYTFKGWTPSIPQRMPWKSVTVKAQWQVNEHNVKWIIDEETILTQTLAYGTKITAPDAPERSGYTLSPWSIHPETMPDEDLTISATYIKDTDVIVAANEEQFTNEVMELVNNGLSSPDFDPQEALEDEFYTCRIVAKCSDFALIDFEELAVDTAVMNDDGTVVLQFANRDLAENCRNKLNEIAGVEFAESDAYISAPESAVIEDIPTVGNSIWGEKYINADKYAHYLENNGFNNLVTVAVIDSGVDSNHPYLNGRILPSGLNCFNSSTFPEDDSGHGTHVSGIIVNCTNNLNVKIMPIKSIGKFTNENGNTYFAGTLQSIIAGINYAAAQNVDVINLSLESPYNTYSTMVERAINNAVEKGVVVVVAAGNGSVTVRDNGAIERTPVDTQYVTPASIENAIVVAALDESGNKASFSNYGASVDVIAPGVRVPSSYLDGKYAYMDGTSQAAPHIAAVAAMFKLAYPEYSPAQMEALIKEYAVDKGPEGRDDYYGEGCPDMYNAIPDCTVTFNTNGGNGLSAATTKNSSSITLPVPKKGYTITWNANGGSFNKSSSTYNDYFEGWYKSADFSGNKYYQGESMMLVKDETLYAKWRNSNMGSVGEPTRNGYRFVGWFTSANGGTQYVSGTSINKNITLYAHWERYSLSFNTTGGSGAPSTIYGYGSFYLPTAKPKRTGYQFLGWGTYSGTSTVEYYPGDRYDLKSNKTLYAVWGQASVTLSKYADSDETSYSQENRTTFNGKTCYRAPLPSVGYSNVNDGIGATGWEAVSGEILGFDDYYFYYRQPGTKAMRYVKNGYYSAVYTTDLRIYKRTKGKNYIWPTTTNEKGTSNNYVDTDVKIYLQEIAYDAGTYKYNGDLHPSATWGKVTCNGITGWIILWY